MYRLYACSAQELGCCLASPGALGDCLELLCHFGNNYVQAVYSSETPFWPLIQLSCGDDYSAFEQTLPILVAGIGP